MMISPVMLAMAMQVVVAAEAPQTDQVDAAYESVAAGLDQQAIARIDSENALDQQDPARLINLGIALAREGRVADARVMFEAAATSETRYRLELADGSWVDSRHLAARAIAMLDGGELSRNSRVAAR